ncbi:MAG: transcription elongation factor GreAB [Pedosphaera sp.]|nr:transcription elongation factor GreAB [Pedosphaera sp.]
MIDKQILIHAILDELHRQFTRLCGAAEESRAGATDGENRSESKYDTRSIEANYLADGQSRQAEKVSLASAALQVLQLRAFGPGDVAGLGALVEVQMRDERMWFFLVPAAGGMEVTVDGNVITLITPEAPLGRQLMGARTGVRTKSPASTVLQVA